jgi:hypothetical protein
MRFEENLKKKLHKTTHIHHIAIYYEVEHLSGELSYSTNMENNDSVGAEWINFELVTAENSSPLVMQALTWLENKKSPNIELARLDGWLIM